MRHLNGYVARRAIWALFSSSFFCSFFCLLRFQSHRRQISSSPHLPFLSGSMNRKDIDEMSKRPIKYLISYDSLSNFYPMRLSDVCRTSFEFLCVARAISFHCWHCTGTSPDRDRRYRGSTRGQDHEREFYVSLVISLSGTRNARHYILSRGTADDSWQKMKRTFYENIGSAYSVGDCINIFWYLFLGILILVKLF